LNQQSASGLEIGSKLAITKLVVFRAVNEYLKAFGEQPDDKLIVSIIEKVPIGEFTKLQDFGEEAAFNKQLEQVMETVLNEYSNLTGLNLDRQRNTG
jgi:hypothetical protein